MIIKVKLSHPKRQQREDLARKGVEREIERLYIYIYIYIYIYHAPLKLIPSSLLLFASLSAPCND
jgi:hypothetical protein